MNFDATDTIYLALAAYALGTLAVLVSLIGNSRRLQHAALLMMIAGFGLHTMWIGTICARTGHPPITNLPETAAFLSWTIFAVELGLSMSKAVYDWIALSLKGSYRRKSGEVVALDLTNAVQSSREFKEALITEIGFPAMDASSKDPAYMTIKFSPEQTVRKKGAGATLTPESTKKQKTWLPSNFRFELKGLPTSKINKVDALTIKQTVVTDGIGETRDYAKEPGKLEFPNVVLTLAESDAQPWLDWFEDFVIRGNNGQEQEKSGSLVYLSPSLQEELGRLDFFNLGIFRVAEEKAESSADQIRRIKVELYCERLELKLPGMAGDG